MRFQSYQIWTPEDSEGEGYYWLHGGYFDTLAECQEDIIRWNHELRAVERAEGR